MEVVILGLSWVVRVLLIIYYENENDVENENDHA
jgi:hypothetical protein